MTKPFNPQELAARVRSQLRRYTLLGDVHAEERQGLIVNGRLTYDPDRRELRADGEAVKLTATETKIVDLLMRNPGRIFPAEEIYRRVWDGEAAYACENTVMVHIRRIREKNRAQSQGARLHQGGVGHWIQNGTARDLTKVWNNLWPGRSGEALKGWRTPRAWRRSASPERPAAGCGRQAGLAALVLGVSLVLGSLGTDGGPPGQRVDSGSFGSGWWSTDWQETPAFRQEVAQRLRAFLAMATGSDLEWWDTASGDTYVVSSAGITWYEWGSTDTATEDIATPKEEAPDASYAEEKNLLYRVQGSGEGLLLQQCSSNMILSSSWAVPEGYNFLLTFQNGTVTISKDGEPVDVYGDGFLQRIPCGTSPAMRISRPGRTRRM